ncbi:MAG: (2Fe-2S)-binding protein [Candidatus Tectimicrobiota bacterium]
MGAHTGVGPDDPALRESGMPPDRAPEWSPLVSVYQALQARQPRWHVAMGQPCGTGWISGSALAMASSGPLQELLTQIGERLQTTDRRTIAASFALRHGWSAGAAIAPYLTHQCVPSLALENVSFKFRADTLFERVALHRPIGAMVWQQGLEPHPLIQFLPTQQALLGYLRASLVQQATPLVETLAAWSRFAVKGLWGMITSSWAAQCMQICQELSEQKDGAEHARALLAGEDVVAQMQPRFYSVTYGQITHVYHRRSTCCRYYLLPQADYCANCPLLSQAERVERNRTWMKNLCEPSASS